MPPDKSCGPAALMLKALAASVANGGREEDTVSDAMEIYRGGSSIPDFTAQDIKISIPAPVVAKAMLAVGQETESSAFSTKLAWPNEDRGVSQTVLDFDFFENMEKYGRAGIRIPVLRILQRATDTAQVSGVGSVEDSIVSAYLCSYYSSFDERFQAVFYPSRYRWHASRDAVLFEASSALSDGVDRTAVSAVSATAAWLGMLIDQSTPVPSLLGDFMSRTGQSSGVASGQRRNTVVLADPSSFPATFRSCLADELPRIPNVHDVFTQQTIELIIADAISTETPASVAQLVTELMNNMGADQYTKQAWKDYCSAIRKSFVDARFETPSDAPVYVSLLPEAQRSIFTHMADDLNIRVAIASASKSKFMKEYENGGAPDYVVLADIDVDGVLAGKIAPDDISVLEQRHLSSFGVPAIYQDMMLASMQKHNRNIIDVEDVFAPYTFKEEDLMFVKRGADRSALHGGVTIDAAEILSAILVLFRGLRLDVAAPDSILDELYGESMVFVYEMKRLYSESICTPAESWLATMATFQYDPRVLGAPIDSPGSAIIKKVLGEAMGIDPFAPSGEYKTHGRDSRPGGKMLARFCTDMVEQAREGKIGEMIIGREAVIENVEAVLLRRDKANPLLLAPAGAGKTAVVEGLAKKIANGDAGVLNGYGICSLDVASLIADGPSVGVMGERVKGIMTEAIDSRTILFIDEIHTIDSIGSGDFNLGNIMKPFLARQGLKVIGATTEREYNYSIAKDKALDRRFSPIHLPKLDFDAVLEVLSAKSQIYGKHHGVVYSDNAANIIALLAEDYMSGRETPDRELDILDVSGSVAASNAKQIVEETDIIQAVKLLTSNKSIKTRKDIARELLGEIGEEDIAKAFPNVAGQRKAKEAILRRVSESKLDISSRNKPRNIFMFVGDSGVGKTYMAHEMAPLLDAGTEDVLSISLGEYQDRASHTRLIGAAPQYVGYQEGGVLTNFAKAHPGGIVVLDEIDKCTEEIKEMFLGVFDTGMLQAADGSIADCRSMTFVCTANTGHGTEKKHTIGFGTQETSEKDALANVKEALKVQFGEPLLNRIDEIVVFDELSEDDLIEICLISYRKLVDKMHRRYGVTLTDVYTEDQLAADAKQRFATSAGKMDARTAWNGFEKEIVPKAIALLD